MEDVKMILDGILSVLALLFNALLAPLEIINIGIDIVSSVPVVAGFVTVVAYIFPWTNILPIIAITLLILNFKNCISLIQNIWRLLPFV